MAELRQEWLIFVNEMDYGMDASRAVVDLRYLNSRPLDRVSEIKVAADQGWQSTELTVTPGQRFTLKAAGRVVIRNADAGQREDGWIAEPHGITLRYHQGLPLGMLQGMIVPKPNAGAAPLPYAQWQRFDPQNSATVECRYDGLLVMRVNEPSSELWDNRGEFVAKFYP